MNGMTPCEHCGAEYPSPLAAAECCDPEWDGRGRE